MAQRILGQALLRRGAADGDRAACARGAPAFKSGLSSVSGLPSAKGEGGTASVRIEPGGDVNCSSSSRSSSPPSIIPTGILRHSTARCPVVPSNQVGSYWYWQQQGSPPGESAFLSRSVTGHRWLALLQ
eukprot:COSAG01_NODE_6623_length_3573_cov_1.487622_4_plen_129_part_00